MAPVLGYWDIRGLATPIRLLLEYVGATYEEKLYSCSPPPDFDRKEWLADKFNLGLKFPNLPYYIDGDIKLSQSGVILRHLARKHNLMGKTEVDQLDVELMAAQVFDYHMDYARNVYSPEFNKVKDAYLASLPDKLKLLSEALGLRQFVAGDYVTYADFLLFEFLEGQAYLAKDIVSSFPILESFHKRILALEPINKYYNSPKFIKFPFNGAPAYFGGPYSEELQKQLQK